MITETRKNIFKIIMGSDDIMDCISSLMRMKLKKNQFKEIPIVVI